MTLEQLKSHALKLDHNDMCELARFAQRIASLATEIRVGDAVSFRARSGYEITGKVLKINKKTVHVAGDRDRYGRKCENGATVKWAVSPVLLRKV